MKVGRKRKTGMDLPKRVYFKHGKYYWFVPPNMVELYGGRKWIPLTHDIDLSLEIAPDSWLRRSGITHKY